MFVTSVMSRLRILRLPAAVPWQNCFDRPAARPPGGLF
jgi:hypothetical protein